MPIVKFLGHIIPDRGLTITNLPQLSFVYPSGLQAQLKIKIEKSLLTVECDLNQYTPSEFEMLHLHVLHISRAAVDVVSFSNGWGLTTVIEDFIDPDGVSKRVQAVDPTLENICTIPHAEVFSLVTDFAVSLILHTLTSTLTQPYLWAVNCARAVESIARLVSPDEDDRRERWRRLREALNVSKDYLKLITDTSTESRHGNLDHLMKPLASTLEVRKRAWTVMYRFLEYRRRASGPLSPADFPLL